MTDHEAEVRRLRAQVHRLEDDKLGVRIPTWVVSPWAKARHIGTDHGRPDLVPQVHRAPLRPASARVSQPPVRHGYAGRGKIPGGGAGATSGPPAPPRDDRTDIGDLFECFTF